MSQLEDSRENLLVVPVYPDYKTPEGRAILRGVFASWVKSNYYLFDGERKAFVETARVLAKVEEPSLFRTDRIAKEDGVRFILALPMQGSPYSKYPAPPSRWAVEKAAKLLKESAVVLRAEGVKRVVIPEVAKELAEELTGRRAPFKKVILVETFLEVEGGRDNGYNGCESKKRTAPVNSR